MEAHLGALEMLGFLDREPSSFERACERADACAPRPEKKRPRPTPQATIEALKQGVRDGGIAALKQPANRERLSRCDAAAKTELLRWLRARKAAA